MDGSRGRAAKIRWACRTYIVDRQIVRRMAVEHIPKKSLGQHWLNDESMLHAMCDMAGVNAGDAVLEIGPGHGTLTEKLLERGTEVTAIEKDEFLASRLNSRAEAKKQLRLHVITGDILTFDLSSMSNGYKVVANIPYYLTSKLIRVLSESSNPPVSVTLLIQKEVAQRLAAGPGSMSLLTVSAGMYFIPGLGPVVPAGLFTPPPKVDSQIVHLERRKKPLFGKTDSKKLFRVVKAGFSNRRKTLLNSLSSGLQLSKEETTHFLDISQIDPKCRPQELSPEQWIRLTNVISQND